MSPIRLVALSFALLGSSCAHQAVVSRANEGDAAFDEELYRTPVRVGGDLDVKAELVPGGGADGADSWRFDRCRIATALPAGYPAPTPPGALEIKRYPRARRAEVGGAMRPEIGMSMAFWPLFQHIKSREIAMTSPVEMDYAGIGDDGRLRADSWTMSFLYREPEMGQLETDGAVRVVDREPLLVLSLGQRGEYSWSRDSEGLTVLNAWLEAHAEWTPAGAPRSLYYNGPELPGRDKWSEVQLPVRRRAL
jgi:hypothetical protein